MLPKGMDGITRRGFFKAASPALLLGLGSIPVGATAALASLSNPACLRIYRDLNALTAGLLYPSESDYPLNLIRLPLDAIPTNERLADLLGLGNKTVTSEQLDRFIRRRFTDFAGIDPETRTTYRRFRELGAYFNRTFGTTNCRAYRIDTIQVKVLFLGFKPGCGYIGTQTVAIET